MTWTSCELRVATFFWESKFWAEANILGSNWWSFLGFANCNTHGELSCDPKKCRHKKCDKKMRYAQKLFMAICCWQKIWWRNSLLVGFARHARHTIRSISGYDPPLWCQVEFHGTNSTCKPCRIFFVKPSKSRTVNGWVEEEFVRSGSLPANLEVSCH